jgi:hypothetical protein
MKMLKIMCLDVLAFIGITVVALGIFAIPVMSLYGYTKLPYEWSHGYFFMTVKWFIVMFSTLGATCLVLGRIFEWIDDVKKRARK